VHSPSPKCHQGAIEDIILKSLVLHHKIFMDERAVLMARCEVLNETLVVIDAKISHLDEEITVLDEE